MLPYAMCVCFSFPCWPFFHWQSVRKRAQRIVWGDRVQMICV